MKKAIHKPSKDEYPERFSAEIEPVQYDDLITGLIASREKVIATIGTLNSDQLAFSYAPGKWTIKEILQHIIDVERVLGYRAMRYARNDKTVLSGFNESGYAIESLANERNWESLLDEYKDVRTTTIHLFNSFNDTMLSNRGTAGKSELTVRAVGYLVLGHDLHHLDIIEQRYLKQF